MDKWRYRWGIRIGWGAALATTLLLGANHCDELPSASIDAGDLLGGFDRDAGPRQETGIISVSSQAAKQSPSAHPSGIGFASAQPLASSFARAPVSATACVQPMTPAESRTLSRTLGRPACRGGQVSEWRDPTGAPRYLCLYPPPPAGAARLPLVLFFHGDTPGLDDPAALTKMTSLRKLAASFDLNANEPEQGFFVGVIQGRALGGDRGASYDTESPADSNVDIATVDHFVVDSMSRHKVDSTRVYTVGMGRGADMAVAYAMWRADRVAAFAIFAPTASIPNWICPTPPPPGYLAYRACDDIARCADVERWGLARSAQRAETEMRRLGEDNKEETHCAPQNACSPKKGQLLHNRWPKGREQEMLRFLATHKLGKE